jgi:peptide/nickel transport system permease protein
VSEVAIPAASASLSRRRPRRASQQWLLKQLGIAGLTILLVATLVFFAARALPGDPALTLAGQGQGGVSPEKIALARKQYGLDRSVPEQYVRYLWRSVHGDLGISIQSGLPVGRTIVDRLGVTAELAVLSVIFSLVVGVVFGVLAALYRGRPADYAINVVGLLGISVPNFWLGLMLILVFALGLDWLPSSGFTPFAQDPIANLEHMILPTVMLGTAIAAVLARQMRAAMIEALQSDYVLTARSKGLRRAQVIFKHALRNCLIPLVTITGLQFGALISSAVVTEQLFILPGLGQLLLSAVLARDYAVVQAVTLVTAVAYVLVNLLVDVLYTVVDPRVRLPGRA